MQEAMSVWITCGGRCHQSRSTGSRARPRKADRLRGVGAWLMPDLEKLYA